QLLVEVFDKDGNLKGEDVCLNDIMIVRGVKPHVTKLELYIDNQKVEKFYGDGLLVSTATGSSAYSLAAGGPLLMPDMKDILVTPISSHTLYGLKYVAGPESIIRIGVDDFETAPIICPDGRDFIELSPFDSIIITRYSKPLKTATLKSDNFFSDVRKKIVQRGSFYENS
nr:NAD(+) kinase [Saccharofermentans sp.]